MDAVKKVTTVERMIRFHIHEYERLRKQVLPVCCKLAGKNIDQTFGIIDLAGLSLGRVTKEARKALGTVAKYDQVRTCWSMMRCTGIASARCGRPQLLLRCQKS